MAFQNPIATLTIPNGATTGPRIVIGNDIPADLTAWAAGIGGVTINNIFLFYLNNTDYYFMGLGTFTALPCFFEGVSSAARGPYVTHRVLDLRGSGGAVEERLGSYALNTTQMIFRIQQTATQFGGSYINDDMHTDIFPWTALTPQSGWSGNLKFRTVGSPDFTAQICSTNMTGGTKADGTTVFTLPFSMAASQDIPINCFGGTISTSQPPHINISAAGVATIWGLGTSTTWTVNHSVNASFS